ncbi:uncharacterized protein LOC135220634 [Macrobrachium nipponense]|uniref:uncharacterized protein LOC135220634 n=1 Tax=Macrobrachium nipponense TaxID=159736 RepID=UPI0030C7DED4
MELKPLLVATAAICLLSGSCRGKVFHAWRHQCIHPPSFTSAPIVYSVVSEVICSFQCCILSCLFFDFSETTGCKIYGAGLEPCNNNRFDFKYYDYYRPTVKEPFIEVAGGKPTFPVPNLASGEHSGKAVDGDAVTTRWEGGSVGAWWMVDLGAHYVVYSVVIVPRPGPFAYRFQAVEVRGGSEYRGDGDFTQWDLLGYYEGPSSYSQGPIYFNKSQGICGRYLAVKRINSLTDVLAFMELYAYVVK